ncbi:uncharacterized protein LOC116181298 [Photinus pyralis]|uniref:uncharacterized protein LOC116181298 n=1 Tax=Photinus pyralis TaxID=7054 RepID=UPI00126764AD|nr:uncharacterized protein LOC116181298 [Photinus pyralis]
MDVEDITRKFANFSRLSLKEKLRIKQEGRPLPDMTIEFKGKSRGKEYVRKFNREIYSRTKWICGCTVKNAFFCFPCVLFGGDTKWTQTGIRDLVHLSDRIQTHGNSKQHILNQMHLSLLGTTNIQAQLDSAYWTNIQKHNEEVTKNRYVLSKIIDCIKFCGAFELALRGHDESETSTNAGIFRGLINFSAELDKTLQDHLQNASVFKGTSKEIQNDLLACILEVYYEEIRKEISAAPFIAVMADETTDVSAKFQMVVIFRYIKDGVPVERFWGFLQPSGHTAQILAENILNVIDPLMGSNKHKLIAQSYNGANVMSVFFSNSPQRVSILDKIVGKKIPRSIPTRWNFKSRTVNVVFEHREALIDCMDEIQNTLTENNTTINKATAIKRMLEDKIFIFWLTFFHHVMPHVDILYNHLQKRTIDAANVKDVVAQFERNIAKIREASIDLIVKEAQEASAAKERFLVTIAVCLLLPEKFIEYEKQFPEDEFNSTVNAFPMLRGVSDHKRSCGVSEVNNLEDVFPEVIKLLEIIVTIPMTTSEAERCFSTLTRIKTFLRNTMTQERLRALAVLSIESRFITATPNFNERVIDKFASKKQRRMELIYKK